MQATLSSCKPLMELNVTPQTTNSNETTDLQLNAEELEPVIAPGISPNHNEIVISALP
jgi:hypothetical protein